MKYEQFLSRLFLGMQTNSIAEGEPWGLPLQFPTQANLFKRLDYSTWHVGKVCLRPEVHSIVLHNCLLSVKNEDGPMNITLPFIVAFG